MSMCGRISCEVAAVVGVMYWTTSGHVVHVETSGGASTTPDSVPLGPSPPPASALDAVSLAPTSGVPVSAVGVHPSPPASGGSTACSNDASSPTIGEASVLGASPGSAAHAAMVEADAERIVARRAAREKSAMIDQVAVSFRSWLTIPALPSGFSAHT